MHTINIYKKWIKKKNIDKKIKIKKSLFYHWYIYYTKNKIYKGVIIRTIYGVTKFSFELLDRVLSKELRSSYIPHCSTVNPYSLRCIYTTPAIEHYLQQKRRTGSYEEWSLHTSGSYFEEIHGKSNKKSENISSHIKFLF